MFPLHIWDQCENMAEALCNKLNEEWNGAEDLQQILTYLVETAIIQRPRNIPQFFADQLECLLAQRTFAEQIKNNTDQPRPIDIICFPVNPYGWCNPALAGKIINCPNFTGFGLPGSTPNGPNGVALNQAHMGPMGVQTAQTVGNMIRMAHTECNRPPGSSKDGYDVEFVISLGSDASGGQAPQTTAQANSYYPNNGMDNRQQPQTTAQANSYYPYNGMDNSQPQQTAQANTYYPYNVLDNRHPQTAQANSYYPNNGMDNRQQQIPQTMGQTMYGQVSQPTWQNIGNRMPQNEAPAAGTQGMYQQSTQQAPWQYNPNNGQVQPLHNTQDNSSPYTECIPQRPPLNIEEEEQRVTKDVGETLLFQNFIQPIMKYLPMSEMFKEKKRLPIDIFERAVREMLANLKELRSVTLSTAQRIVDCFVRHYHDQLVIRRLEYGLTEDDIKYQVEIFQMIVAACIAGAGVALIGEKYKLDDPVLLANLASSAEAERLLEMRHHYPPTDQLNEGRPINSPYGVCIPPNAEPPINEEQVPKDIGEQLLFQNYVQPILKFLPMSDLFTGERKKLQTDIFEKAIKGLLLSLKDLKSITQAKAQRILDCFVHHYRSELMSGKKECCLSDFDIQVQVEIFEMIVAACIAGAGITMLGDRYNLNDPEFLAVVAGSPGSSAGGMQGQMTQHNTSGLQDVGVQGLKFSNYQNIPPSSYNPGTYLSKFESDGSASGLYTYPTNLQSQTYGHAVQGAGGVAYTPGKYSTQASIAKVDGYNTVHNPLNAPKTGEETQTSHNSIKSGPKSVQESNTSTKSSGPKADQSVQDSKTSAKSVDLKTDKSIKDSNISNKSAAHKSDQSINDSKYSINKSVGSKTGQTVQDSSAAIKSVEPKGSKNSVKSIRTKTAETMQDTKNDATAEKADRFKTEPGTSKGTQPDAISEPAASSLPDATIQGDPRSVESLFGSQQTKPVFAPNSVKVKPAQINPHYVDIFRSFLPDDFDPSDSLYGLTTSPGTGNYSTSSKDPNGWTSHDTIIPQKESQKPLVFAAPRRTENETSAKAGNVFSSRLPDDFDPSESLLTLIKIQKQKLEAKEKKVKQEISTLKKELEENQNDVDIINKLKYLEDEDIMLNKEEKQLNQVEKAARHYKEDEKNNPHESVKKELTEVYRYMQRDSEDESRVNGLLEMNKKLKKYYNELSDVHKGQHYSTDMSELLEVVETIPARFVPEIIASGPDNASDISISLDKEGTKSNTSIENKKVHRRHHRKKKRGNADERSRNSIVETNGFEWTPDASLRGVADSIFQSLQDSHSSENGSSHYY